MENITDLLHEFQDLFPTKFFEMKGILGVLVSLGRPGFPLMYKQNPSSLVLSVTDHRAV